jgi:hypothetical protein
MDFERNHFMNTRKAIFKQIADVYENTVMICTTALLYWGVFQFACLTLGDVCVHLAVLGQSWQSNMATYCVEQIPKCQKVSFNQQYLTTQHAGPRWQWVGARLDITIVCPGGTSESLRQALVEYMGPWTADRVSLHFVDSKGQKWA